MTPPSGTPLSIPGAKDARDQLCAARIEPIYDPRIWGTRKLSPLFPDPPADSNPIGEVWLTGDECRFASGPFAGRKLGEAWNELPVEWTGTHQRGRLRIPLLAKFIYAEEYLSVQVHPDDEYASRHEQNAGGLGKTEMWYVIAARFGAELRVGLRPDVTRESFARAIREGSADRDLVSLPVREGDAVFVPARTAHTIGPGLLLCEIQENSDITYRVYDYNRLGPDGKPRELHVEKALEVLRFGEQIGGRVAPVHLASENGDRSLLVACRYFAVERWAVASPCDSKTSLKRYELLIGIEGAGKLASRGESADYTAGQTWFLPAALGEYKILPSVASTFLRAYTPDLATLDRELTAQGVDAAARSKVVFA